MNYTQLMSYKSAIISLMTSYGVKETRVFGSILTDNVREDSDIDFLVSWPAKHSLFDRMRLKRELAELLEKPVDLVTEKSLYPGIRDKVLATAKPL